MPRRALELTRAEWTVIKAIWALEPCTAPEVRARLVGETRWSYSTVRTIMDRMAAKGLLVAHKDSKVTRFRSALSRSQAQRGELLYALKHAFDGALTPMVQCLLETEKISPEEIAELESMLKAKKKAKPGPGA